MRKDHSQNEAVPKFLGNFFGCCQQTLYTKRKAKSFDKKSALDVSFMRQQKKGAWKKSGWIHET